MPPEQDSQTRAISSGLKKLQDLLGNPVAMSALELSKNAKAAAQYSILKRLSKSLLQYIERDGALFYVGLIGHFSAGKTSSINSLLQTWKTEFERKTDFHPTDKTITLITREKNADSLLGVVREGHVPIRLQKIESPILDQIVLVDTPGTGDPEFFEEVARDFLPICDVILFLFSAASPLDASDVPLLNELHSRLPFIPLHFVVTRADELRINPDQPLSEANFDTTKAAHFLDSAVSRVNALLTPQVYQSSSFTLIDNRSKFRLELLRRFIENKCDASNPQAHISMHMNKLQFYLEGARELREFFAGILDHKLTEVNRIVDAAARNIARYQEIVQISNSNLTKTWFEAAVAINKVSARSNEALRAPTILPADFDWLQSVNNKRIELVKDMDRDARFAAQTIALGARSLVLNSLREKIYDLEKSVAETMIPKLSAAEQKVELSTIRVEVKEMDVISSAVLVRRYNDLRDAEAGALRDAAGDLRRLIKELGDVVNQGAQLTECTSVIEGARSSLKSDLGKFFHNVELYRTGVFSHTTKEAISTLGIGRELDQLENEFTEEDKEQFATEATLQLFPDVDELMTNVRNKFMLVSGKASALTEAARGLRLERPESPTRSIQDALSLARETLASDLTQGLQADVALFSSEVNIRISKAIVDAKARYDYRIYHFRRERRRSYFTACALAGIVWLAVFFAFHHHERPAPKSAIGELVLSVLAGVILQVGTVLFVRWWKSLPKLLNRTEEEVHSKLNNDIREEISEALEGIKFDSLDEATLTIRLNQIYVQALSVENTNWRSIAIEFLKSTKDVQANFAAARQEQLAHIEDLRAGALRYFTDPSRNLSLLTGVALQIKERAIEPSFKLLDTTREQLLAVKNQVTTVSFD
jgi:predicted GTPase